MYTGIAKDVQRRLDEHRQSGPKAAKYLRGRGPLDVVYQREVGTHSEALKEERRIKRLTKAQKERLLLEGA